MKNDLRPRGPELGRCVYGQPADQQPSRTSRGPTAALLGKTVTDPVYGMTVGPFSGLAYRDGDVGGASP